MGKAQPSPLRLDYGPAMLFPCVKPTPELVFGHLINPDVNASISLANDRIPTNLPIRLFGASVGPTLLYGCESRKLKDRVANELNSGSSRMLAKMTGRETVNEARTPTVNVLSGARDQRCNWLWHALRKDERRTVQQALLNWVKLTPESIFCDLIDPDVNAAINLANDSLQ